MQATWRRPLLVLPALWQLSRHSRVSFRGCFEDRPRCNRKLSLLNLEGGWNHCSPVSLTVGGGGISFGVASRLRDFSRLTCENGEIGGCTGATGRGGISVRGATGGGGLEVGGWPSASNNLRIRSSSDSMGARCIGAASLAVSMFASSDLCLSWLPSSPGTGTRQRPRQAKGKANYRNWRQSLVTSL